jgi:hypothetical protein
MCEDSIPKPTTTLLHLNEGEMEIEENKEDENTDVEFEHNKDYVYIIQLNDVQAQHTDNTGNHYICIDDDVNITVVHIDKENLVEDADLEMMMKSLFGENILFIDLELF